LPPEGEEKGDILLFYGGGRISRGEGTAREEMRRAGLGLARLVAEVARGGGVAGRAISFPTALP